jgi:UDP-4-amino-4,6-dideoxy-N-acetyl-beta-L-altrosamine transaminase
MRTYIPYGQQSITEDDIDAVVQVLRSPWLTQGPIIQQFEQAVADYCGAKYAIAVSNATAALHLACLAIGLGSGDLLWTSPNTFVASANCARYCGADVDFVDIDPKTYNLSILALQEKLEIAAKNGKLPKAIIPVHFAGQSCDMAAIAHLAHQYGIQIIEDASHALGGKYQGQRIGSCEFSEMTIFSFHPVKMITTGEGGMIVTNSLELYEKLEQLRSHGIAKSPHLFTQEAPGDWYYEQQTLGLNYRLTDIQAALGLSQIQRLDQFVARRQELADRYQSKLQGLPLETPIVHTENQSSYHLYVVRLKLDKLARSKSEIFRALQDRGIGVQVHYIPVHTQPYYQSLGFKWGDYPIAEAYYAETMSLPIHYDLTHEEQDYIIQTLKEVIQ